MGIADDLKKLAQLRDSGALTEEEFQKKKAQILGDDTTPATDTTRSTDKAGAGADTSGQKEEWYRNPLAIAALTIVCFPFGALLLWTNKDSSSWISTMGGKVALTAVGGLIFLAAIAGGGDKQTDTGKSGDIQTSTETSVKVSEDNLGESSQIRKLNELITKHPMAESIVINVTSEAAYGVSSSGDAGYNCENGECRSFFSSEDEARTRIFYTPKDGKLIRMTVSRKSKNTRLVEEYRLTKEQLAAKVAKANECSEKVREEFNPKDGETRDRSGEWDAIKKRCNFATYPAPLRKFTERCETNCWSW